VNHKWLLIDQAFTNIQTEPETRPFVSKYFSAGNTALLIEANFQTEG